MRRASRDNGFRTPYLETALAKCPETYGRLDIIAFGFPCQDISSANPKGKGFEGKKSSIFYECMRIVDILQPGWIIIENVKRLLSINEGRDFGIVLQKMAESGYGYQWNVLNSQNFGVPQRRERVFIVGRFGAVPPPEILFQLEGDQRNVQENACASPKSKCITTRSGYTGRASAETFIGATITTGTGIRNTKRDNIVAKTLGTGGRGYNGWMWQENYITEPYTDGEREVAGISAGLDSARGTVIGNAVTVPVAKEIGRRIKVYG